jgi:predicted Zn-dependent protease
MIAALLIAGLLPSVQEPPEKAAEFARGLETAVAKGEFITFDLALDPDAFYDRVVGATKLTPSVVRFLKPVIRTTFTSTPIFAVLKGQLNYKFLKVRKTDDGFRALFRMTGENATFNYHELLVVPDQDGFKVVDYFVLNAGEFQSDLTRRIIMPSPQALKVLRELLAPTPGDFMLDYSSKDLNQLSQLFTGGQYQEALDLYYRKSAVLKKVKIAQVLHINAARMIDQAAHQKAVDDMRDVFKDEPALYIAAVGGYLQFKQLDKALEAIDRIDQTVGGDVFLNLIRARAHLQVKDPAKARDLARTVTEKEPKLEHGWWIRIEAHLALKEFKEVARCLSLAEKNLEVTFEDLAEEEAYAEFVKSSEYAEWLKERGGKK